MLCLKLLWHRCVREVAIVYASPAAVEASHTFEIAVPLVLWKEKVKERHCQLRDSEDPSDNPLAREKAAVHPE